MPQQPSKYLLHAALALCLSGCRVELLSFLPLQYEAVGDTGTLAGLSKAGAVRKYKTDSSATQLRQQSLHDYAFTVSAQAGCAHHMQRLEKLLGQLEKVLDRVYSLHVWMLPHNVLPPVLVQAQQSISLLDQKTMRIADRTYHIEQDAKFVSTPPHWRYDYLMKDLPSFTQNLPQSFIIDLLPKNKEERKVWQKAVKEGWQAGIEQARHNFIINLSTLERTLNGMILYRKLLAKGMVSAPYVSYTPLGVTGDERTIHVNDQILKITAVPVLHSATNKWIPIVSKEEKTKDDSSIPASE